MDLGDRVLYPASGAEAVAARLEVRLEDRLEHRLEGGLHHPVAHGRDAQPARFAAALGDHHLPYRFRGEPAGLEIVSQLRQEAVLAHDGRDVAGGAPVHPGRASPSVAPDPRPGIHQDRRVIDEVVQIIEPTVGIVGRPLMQLGLDSQYSRLGQLGRRPRSVGIHRRPPAIPQPPCELAAPLRHPCCANKYVAVRRGGVWIGGDRARWRDIFLGPARGSRGTRVAGRSRGSARVWRWWVWCGQARVA